MDRILSLDLLRGVAALIVVAGHTGWLGRITGNPSNIDYTMAVAFFFILSGYVLSFAFSEAVRSNDMSAPDFIAARFARLYPLHALTALITATVMFALNKSSEITDIKSFETITLTQSIFSGDWSLNAPSWSIGAEFWCGLILLALWSKLSAVRIAATALGGLALIAIEFRAGFIGTYTGRYGTALGCFVLGWLVFSMKPRTNAPLGWMLIVVSFTSMAFPPVQAQGRPAIELLYMALFSAAIFLLASAELPKSMQGISRLLGNLSYGIYLWHWPLMLAFPPYSPKRLVIYLVALIAVSWMSYVTFERPAKLLLVLRWKALKDRLQRTQSLHP